jgi:hypothetical protein
MIRGPVKIYEITDITDTRDRSVEVMLADTGKRVRFPRSQVQFDYHRVIVPVWLVEKMSKSLKKDVSA